MGHNASPATPVLPQRRANVVALEGDIDLHVSPVVVESLTEVIKREPKRVVIFPRDLHR